MIYNTGWEGIMYVIEENCCLYYHLCNICNFDLLTPHFYIVKLGFRVVFIIFLFLLLNKDCGYSLEPPHD